MGRRALGHELAKRVKGRIKTEVIVEQVVAQLPSLLDIELPEILVNAWKELSEIARYADPDRYPPAETVLVPMIEHSIVSTHKPKLELLINDVALGEITFDVHLELVVQGVMLRIQGGRIKGITIASCKAGGKISYGHTPIFKRESAPFTLPATIDLGDGIAIRD